MKIHELKSSKGARKRHTRKGRGMASGLGKTSGRGHGGLKSRSGSSGGTRPGFEGGQTPLIIRVPKRGFTNIFGTIYATVNIRDLEERFKDGDVVDADSLKEVGLIRKPLSGIKVLGEGEISKKLTVKAAAFSASATEKISKAGGKTEVV